jgi:hypothetical protein
MQIPKKIKIEILNYDKYNQNNKFRDSARYLKVDFEFLESLLFNSELNAEDAILFQIIMLTSFRQQASTIIVPMSALAKFMPHPWPILKRLVLNDFIYLSTYNIIKLNKIKLKTSAEQKNEGVDLGHLEARPPLTHEEISAEIKKISQGIKK